MPIGDWAIHAVETGMGRYISREEALETVGISEKEGLVFQPSNAQNADFICACCGCCCGMLRMHRALSKPVAFWATNFYAAVDPGSCTGCETCIDRCQVKAVDMDSRLGIAAINRDRCLGCGNCVTTCPSEALHLVKKEQESVPPENSERLYDTILAHKKGPFGKAKLGLRLLLKK